MRKEIELALAISYQNIYETENFVVDVNVNKAKANNNNLALAKNQYPTPDPSVLKAFLANSIGLWAKKIEISRNSSSTFCDSKNGNIGFCYVDNIVFAYKKN